MHRALIEDDDAVRERHRLGLVVGDVDEGEAHAPLQVLELDAHALAQLGIEIGERLVEQQDRRLDNQRARQRHALLLAAGELSRMALLEPGKSDGVQHMRDPFLNLAPVDLGDPETEGHVFEDGHVRPHGVVLEHHAHAALLGRNDPHGRRERPATDVDGASVRREEARKGAQHRCLAAA